ncbi:LicD family protein [Helicobacter sp. MIT 05-5293]|uniref:LicD family protein n=1 Tax=Helicobacter sp. MIT 05-5293 TaxID=1548149 RepID=UPI00051D3583|nr:LicD family protein [Helicobacter sp. MIT 05-5293]TLD82011.1 LicD family protein [Helicobacter sp. MIT 05-5293]
MNLMQAELLQISKAFKKACEEHQLRYFMIGGTLLGAVRHQGFIPWDDDMDFVMPRADYEKLIGLFEQGDLGLESQYNLCYIKPNDTYYFPFIKLEDMNTTLIDKYESPTAKVIKFPFCKCDDKEPRGNIVYQTMGVNIDIFPLDYMKGNYKDHLTHYGIFRLMMQFPHCDIARLSRGLLKKILLKGIKALPREYVLKKVGHTMRFGPQKDSGKYLSYWYAIWGYRVHFDKKDFEESVSLAFEDTSFLAPKNFDRILKLTFGDYMSLPPEEERFTHANDDTIIDLNSPYKDAKYKGFLHPRNDKRNTQTDSLYHY